MEIACPKCGSHDLFAGKKGFSGKKAIAGAVLTGGVGLLAGTIGSNKVKITCLKCGNEFYPGEKPPTLEQIAKSDAVKAKNKKINKVLIPILIGIIVLLIIMIKTTSK